MAACHRSKAIATLSFALAAGDKLLLPIALDSRRVLRMMPLCHTLLAARLAFWSDADEEETNRKVLVSILLTVRNDSDDDSDFESEKKLYLLYSCG